MQSNTKLAFTLAEVLIVLTIIGIVAAITIPALMQSTQDQQLKVAWKKEYSVLEQATRRTLSDNGASFKGVCADYDHDCLKKLYSPYLNIAKSCDEGSNAGNCWHNADKWWMLNGDLQWWGTSYNDCSGAILNDGTFLTFCYRSSACNDIDNSCGAVSVDINGSKGPNVVGKDIFGANLNENGVKPFGSAGQTGTMAANTCASDNSGMGCSAAYLYQN